MTPCVHSDRLHSRFEFRTIASPRSPSVTLRNRFQRDFERRIARASRTITHLQNNPCSHNLPVFHSLHRLKPATSGIMVRFRTREPHNLCAGEISVLPLNAAKRIAKLFEIRIAPLLPFAPARSKDQPARSLLLPQPSLAPPNPERLLSGSHPENPENPDKTLPA